MSQVTRLLKIDVKTGSIDLVDNDVFHFFNEYKHLLQMAILQPFNSLDQLVANMDVIAQTPT